MHASQPNSTDKPGQPGPASLSVPSWIPPQPTAQAALQMPVPGVSRVPMMNGAFNPSLSLPPTTVSGMNGGASTQIPLSPKSLFTPQCVFTPNGPLLRPPVSARKPQEQSTSDGSSQESRREPNIEYLIGGTPMDDCTRLVNEPQLKGWLRLIHVDGSAYYYDQKRSIITTANILEAQTFNKFTEDYDEFKQKLTGLSFKVNYDVVVIRYIDVSPKPVIYMLHYREGSYKELFPEGCPGKDLLVEIKSERYWSAIQDFPMHLKTPPKDIEADFLAALSFGASERILEWSETAFPFTNDQIQRLIQVYRNLKADLDRGTQVVPAYSWHLARTMTKIEESRRKTKFGTADFGFYRDTVASTLDWKTRVAETCLSFILFGAHRMYRTRLQSTRVKGVLYLPEFRELLQHFLAEWSDSNLLATVFVGANIAFLAVPDITNIQRTASLASTVFAVLSVATGVHHVWQHRSKADANYEEAKRYLSRPETENEGENDTDLAITACFLCIPLVALLYAVLSFSIALGAFCVQNTELRSRILLCTVLGVVGFAGFATLVFFWHIWVGPRKVNYGDDRTDEMDYGWRSRARSFVKDAALGTRAIIPWSKARKAKKAPKDEV